MGNSAWFSSRRARLETSAGADKVAAPPQCCSVKLYEISLMEPRPARRGATLAAPPAPASNRRHECDPSACESFCPCGGPDALLRGGCQLVLRARRRRRQGARGPIGKGDVREGAAGPGGGAPARVAAGADGR